MQEEQRDQRAYLKVKIKSLAEEAKIIRTEERKPHGDMDKNGYSAKRTGLYLHRVGTVRRESRHALLAYGFIRGRKYRQMEAKCEFPPGWKSVERMIVKYGPQDIPKEELHRRFEEWQSETTS